MSATRGYDILFPIVKIIMGKYVYPSGDIMGKKCIGLIECIGLASAISAADAALKSADISLIGYEYSTYSARIVVKVEGNAGAVRAAVAAGKAATSQVHGSLSGCQTSTMKFALDERVYDMLIHNEQTVGDPLQIASGKRPQGTTRKGKRVGVWNPKGHYITE